MKREADNKLWLGVGLRAAFPLVALGAPAFFMDRYFGTGPWITLSSVFVAFNISLILVSLKTKQYLSNF